MENADIEQKVAGHYTQGNVINRIVEALGLEPDKQGQVSVETLFPVDQLHHGGVALTEKMAEHAGMCKGMKVLDAGSGIGGAARFLVDRFGCEVDAIDLSEEYVSSARALDKIVGLAGRIVHRVGSVTELPFPGEAFNVVWCQNVTMNVPDKTAMFAEVYRVLREGGVYVLSHLGESKRGTMDYPLPWAMTAETSFASPPDTMLQLLADAGFHRVTNHGPNARPPPLPSSSTGQPQDMFAMGDDMPQRRANVAHAVADGRLVPMLITAYR